MTTFTVQIPDKKADFAKQLLKEFGAVIADTANGEQENAYECSKSHTPNFETVKAMEDARSGKVKK